MKIQVTTEFHTHSFLNAELLHGVAETLLLPARINVQLLARAIVPLPGKNKDCYLAGLAVRITSLALWAMSLPFAVVSTLVGITLRSIAHMYRPSISYIDAAKGPPKLLELTKERPLHIRTHNVGFVSTTMSILGDLRDPLERAGELAESIVADPSQPDIIFFQEAFHEDATKFLCTALKRQYPYIIHSVEPHLSGLSSGNLIASKYPVRDIHFEQFGNLIGPEALSPRGMIRLTVDSKQGQVHIYGMHTQAFPGELRAQARLAQINQLFKAVERDRRLDENSIQIVLGDFNSSRVTLWGEDNLEPKNQAEGQVLERIESCFDDLFLRDHDAFSGKRTSGAPMYLQTDNARMQEDLEEPRGSWYYGPLADKGLLELKLRVDRYFHGRDAPNKVAGVAVEPSCWGTEAWHAKQVANTARFDYILIPKNGRKVDGRVEIRRTVVPKGVQSASTDHLPVDATIWV